MIAAQGSRRQGAGLVAIMTSMCLIAACTATEAGHGRGQDPGRPGGDSGSVQSTPSDPATTSGSTIQWTGHTTSPVSAPPLDTGRGATTSTPPHSTSEAPEVDPAPVVFQPLPATAIVWSPSSPELSAAMSSYLFASSPVVVLATSAALESGLVQKGIGMTPLPVLVAPEVGAVSTSTTGVERGSSGDTAVAANKSALAAEIARLGARWILSIGDGASGAAHQLSVLAANVAETGGAAPQSPAVAPQVVASLDEVPTLRFPTTLTSTVGVMAASLLDPGGAGDAAADAPADDDATGGTGGEAAAGAPADGAAEADSAVAAGAAAVRLMARAAGMHIVAIDGSDPRADTAVIAALAATPPKSVMAVGPAFSSTKRLASRLAIAETGVELPGGGQVMFPGRTLVALYGHPNSTGLGALGQQTLAASITRAAKVAQPYEALVDGPVVPTFEIIASVATASPGAGGDYTVESRVSTLKPWVDKATAAGMYVILDLQPGRARLLDQAKSYEELLLHPNVGLALDPEWKLGPHQYPLEQIGGVDASEVNAVIDWLGALVAEHHLPQKVLVLHQFKLSMLRNEDQIQTGHDNVAVLIHMDGQGSPSGKEATWRAVVANAPDGAFFGWKNFYEMDHPMMSPAETMDRKPKPVMISYQ